MRRFFRTKIIVTLIIIAILAFVAFSFLGIGKNKNGFLTEQAVVGTVVKEITETGTIKASEDVNLSFKSSGKIAQIYVKVGDEVKAGRELAKLDTTNLLNQLSQAQASLNVTEAQKSDTKVLLDTAKRSLIDANAEAAKDLNNAYDSALSVLDDSYVKIYSAYTVVDEIQRNYFFFYQGDSGRVIDGEDTIKNALDRAKNSLDNAKKYQNGESTEATVKEFKTQLSLISTALNNVSTIARSAGYTILISSTDKASLDTQRTNIATAYSNVVGTEQNIATVKVANKTDINNAQANVTKYENQLENAKDSLYEAKIEESGANVSLLQSQIGEAVIKSPIDGKIAEINKKVGEITQPTDSFISVLSSGPFQIKVDIYEGDIIDVKEGNPVKINLVAKPDITLKGKVAKIDPAEKLIDNVVYYETTIDILDNLEGVRQGMTADLVIEVGRKDNVLEVSQKAVEKINDVKKIQVLVSGKAEERTVKIGLEGNDYVEIISGLKEGEEVVVGKKI